MVERVFLKRAVALVQEYANCTKAGDQDVVEAVIIQVTTQAPV